MKKSFLLFAIFAFLCFTNLFAQQTIESHYGNPGLDVAYSAAATNDGGYIITGLTKSMLDQNGDIVVIKVSAHGDTTWSRTYGGPFLEGGNFVMQTADGNYMVSGHTQDFGAQDCDAFLMKLDQYGNNMWIKTYGGDSDDISESVVELPGGGYVIGGMTASYGNVGVSMNRHLYFIKTNSAGDTIWTKVYAGSGVEECYSIAAMQDGGFLAACWTTSWGNISGDGWLVRMNSSGDTLWTRLYKNGGDTRLFKILATMDDGFIVAAYTTPIVGGVREAMIIKLDAYGNELWKKTFSNPSSVMLHDVVQLPTGNFMFTGGSFPTPTTGNVYVLTTDANGNKLSDQFCGGTNSWANAIAAQGNNSYLIAGSAAKYGDPDGDLYFMELDNTISAHVQTTTTQQPHLYPNPIIDQPAIVVLPEAEANGKVHIDIFSKDGRKMYSKYNILAKDIIISRDQFPPAQYHFRIICKDEAQYTGEFVVE
jgi:hypothetical protein